MPSTISNYPNSFYKFYNCKVEECINSYDGCQPIPDVIPNMGLNITPVIPPTYDGVQFLIIPLPCDIWDCGTLNGSSPDYSYFATFTTFLEDIYSTQPWLQDFLLTNTGTYFNTANSSSVSTFFTNIGYTTMPKCFCWYVVEMKRNLAGEEFSAIIGKSNVMCLTEYTCDVVKVSYQNNDLSFGFPTISPAYYEAYFWGQVWKPTTKNEGKVYVKSNGEVINVVDRFDEYYNIKGRLTEYQYIKAINTALKSKVCIIQNKTLDQFAGEVTQLHSYLEEDIEMNYVNGCYSSASFTAKIRNKQPNGSINYNC